MLGRHTCVTRPQRVNYASFTHYNMYRYIGMKKSKRYLHFCEARRASHCHSPQTTFSSNSTCCVLSTQKSAMHVVVYADRLTTQHSIVDIVHWSWSYWQFCYPRWRVECFWAALAAHWISSASHTSVLPQHPRRKIVPYRVGWNHHTSDYYG